MISSIPPRAKGEKSGKTFGRKIWRKFWAKNWAKSLTKLLGEKSGEVSDETLGQRIMFFCNMLLILIYPSSVFFSFLSNNILPKLSPDFGPKFCPIMGYQ